MIEQPILLLCIIHNYPCFSETFLGLALTTPTCVQFEVKLQAHMLHKDQLLLYCMLEKRDY